MTAITKQISPPIASCSSHHDAFDQALSFLSLNTHLTHQQDAMNNAISCLSEDPKVLPFQILNLVHTLVSTRSQGCSNEREAFLLILPKIKDPDALRLAAAHTFLPNKPQDALWYAAFTGDLLMAQEALTQGADVNELLYPGMTALLLACQQGHAGLVHFLLDQRANIKFVSFTTPLSEARLRPEKMASCLPRLEALDGGFTDEIMSRKHLAHGFSVTHPKSMIEGCHLTLEGFYTDHTLSHYLNESKSFYETLNQELLIGEGELINAILNPEERADPKIRESIRAVFQTVRSTFEHYHEFQKKNLKQTPEKMVEESLKRLDEGKPIICFEGLRVNHKWDSGVPTEHAWGLVITPFHTQPGPFYVQSCNRGDSAITQAGIIGKFCPRIKIVALLKRYHSVNNGATDFTNAGLGIRNQIEKELAEHPVKHIRQKGQRIGNCAVKTLNAIRTALPFALLRPLLGDDRSEAMVKIAERLCTQMMNQKSLSRYLVRHNTHASSHLPDWELLNLIFEKAKTKGKLPHYEEQLAPHAEKFQLLPDRQLLRTQFSQGVGTELDPEKIDIAEKIRHFLFHEIPSWRLDHLTDLNLSRLNIEILFPEITRLTHLRNLNLDYNDLQELTLFGMPSLQHLSANHNQIKTANVRAMPKLVTIDLNYNSIHKLALENLPSLISFTAIENQLSRFPSTHLPELRSLTLTDNLLTQIPHHQDLPNLFTLYLQSNQIRTLLRRDYPSSMKSDFISLQGNPLHFIYDRECDEWPCCVNSCG